MTYNNMEAIISTNNTQCIKTNNNLLCCHGVTNEVQLLFKIISFGVMVAMQNDLKGFILLEIKVL